MIMKDHSKTWQAENEKIEFSHKSLLPYLIAVAVFIIISIMLLVIIPSKPGTAKLENEILTENSKINLHK